MQALEYPKCAGRFEADAQNPQFLRCAYCGFTLRAQAATAASPASAGGDIADEHGFWIALYGERAQAMLGYVRSRLAEADFAGARELIAEMLRLYPKMAEAHWLLLLAECKATDEDALLHMDIPFTALDSYHDAMRLATDAQAARWSAIGERMRVIIPANAEQILAKARNMLGLNAEALREGIALCEQLPPNYPGVAELKQNLKEELKHLEPGQTTTGGYTVIGIFALCVYLIIWFLNAIYR